MSYFWSKKQCWAGRGRQARLWGHTHRGHGSGGSLPWETEKYSGMGCSVDGHCWQKGHAHRVERWLNWAELTGMPGKPLTLRCVSH